MTEEEDDYIQEELNNAKIQYQNWNRQNYNKNKNSGLSSLNRSYDHKNDF